MTVVVPADSVPVLRKMISISSGLSYGVGKTPTSDFLVTVASRTLIRNEVF